MRSRRYYRLRHHHQRYDMHPSLRPFVIDFSIKTKQKRDTNIDMNSFIEIVVFAMHIRKYLNDSKFTFFDLHFHVYKM